MSKKKQGDNPIREEEEQAELESSAETEEESAGEMSDEDEDAALDMEHAVGDEVAEPAEVAAINIDNETAIEADKGVEKHEEEIRGELKVEKGGNKAKKEVQDKKEIVAKTKSKRYLKMSFLVDKTKRYPLEEAVELVKKTSMARFDASVEIHIKLLEKKGKKKGPEDSGRGIFHLPNGLGKELKVVILDEKMADEIFTSKKVNFDVAIAKPDLMQKLGKIAKILGPKGKMPNSKFGTVSDDPEKAREDILSGKVEYKADTGGVIHQMVGKVSWEDEKIKENILSVLQSLPKTRIESVSVASTMGPGVKVEW